MCWARGTDVRLTSAGRSPGCGLALAGFQGVQLKTKEGGSTPSGCQAACLTVRWSELVCYRVSAAQTENSVSRQAGATGGDQPSGALERLSLKALRKCFLHIFFLISLQILPKILLFISRFK